MKTELVPLLASVKQDLKNSGATAGEVIEFVSELLDGMAATHFPSGPPAEGEEPATDGFILATGLDKGQRSESGKKMILCQLFSWGTPDVLDHLVRHASAKMRKPDDVLEAIVAAIKKAASRPESTEANKN